MEDNDSTLKAFAKGYSPALKGFHRTHRVHLGWLYEVLNEFEAAEGEGTYDVVYAKTDTRKGDFFTKPLSPDAFRRAMDLIKLELR